MLVYGVTVANDTLYPPCVSSEGEEDRGCGPAKAAAVRDGAHCENVRGPRDNKADAVHQVKPVIFKSRVVFSLSIIPKLILCLA